MKITKSTIYLSLAIALIVLVGAGVVWYAQSTQKEIETVENLPVVTTNPSEEVDFDSLNKTLDRHKITGVEDLEGPYKKVAVNNGEIMFSFEVPDNWLTETRNSGEVEMNEEELREFMATNYNLEDDVLQKDSDRSMYANITMRELGKMSLKQLRILYAERLKSLGVSYPFLSLSSDGKNILYVAGNVYQIDFFLSYDSSGIVWKEKADLDHNKDLKVFASGEALDDITDVASSGDGEVLYQIKKEEETLFILRKFSPPLDTRKSHENGLDHILETISIINAY
ncbi:MAG: hypothetical protein KC736_04520 [Candidatus Moranbacteria bacterium]|nr:hypothetical protein [Candidatus Moranbacteria bacterium]